MKVVIHQAVGDYLDSVALTKLIQLRQEVSSVVMVPEYMLAVVAATEDVVIAALVVALLSCCHDIPLICEGPTIPYKRRTPATPEIARRTHRTHRHPRAHTQNTPFAGGVLFNRSLD
jgi:hypothetical protein